MNENDVKKAVLAEYPAMYRLALSIVRNADDAMDVVQESVYKAITGAGAVRDASRIHAWLMTVTQRTAIDSLRSIRHEIVTDEAEMPETGVNDTYEDTDLLRAMETLNERERSAVVMRYFEGLKIREVAAALKLNVNSTKTLLRRALAKMKLSLGDDAPRE